MNKQELRIYYTLYKSPDELSDSDRELVKTAAEAGRKAYAPYSGFCVGAAVRLENGQIFIGNNQENSAYPSGLCAERVALFAASAQQPGIPVESIAIAADTSVIGSGMPVTPCGSCRQVMAEYENVGRRPMRILLKGSGDEIWLLEGVSNLLPLMFYSEKLKK